MQNARSRRIMFQFVSDLTRCFFLAAAVGSLVVSQINCSSFLTDRRKLLNNSRNSTAFSSKLSAWFHIFRFSIWNFLISLSSFLIKKIESCYYPTRKRRKENCTKTECAWSWRLQQYCIRTWHTLRRERDTQTKIACYQIIFENLKTYSYGSRRRRER